MCGSGNRNNVRNAKGKIRMTNVFGKFAFRIGATLLLAAPALAATPDHLDPGALIDGLARRNMSDLLAHLVASEPPDDPVVAAQIDIAQLAMRTADPILSRQQQIDAVQRMTAVTEQLIADHGDHEQRPVWQTDLAERYFELHLAFAHIHAAAFYDLGITTAEQRRAVEDHVADIFIHLAQADVRFRQLEDELARDAERRRMLDNTGQWTRLFEQYWRHKTQYYLALAAYHTALLPETHPYYRNLGEVRVPMQQRTAALERARLLDLAINTLDAMVRDSSSYMHKEARLSCALLLGRALAQRELYAEALAALAPVNEAGKGDMTHLLAALTRARALHRQSQSGSAELLLLELDRHPWAQANNALRLLVKDQLHRLLLDRAAAAAPAQRDALIAEAFEPYFALLAELRRQADPQQLQLAAGLENYIYQRWKENVDPRGMMHNLPAAVVMGIGVAARAEGEQLARQAMQAQRDGDDAAAARLSAEARQRLHHAIELLDPLLRRDELTLPPFDRDRPPADEAAHRRLDFLRAVRARTMYNLALATYWTDPLDSDIVLTAALQWTDLARQLPDQRESETAIEFAVKELARVYFLAPGTAGFQSAFNESLEVLFSSFPTTRFADDFRLTYITQTLMPTGRYEQVVRIADRVPFMHVSYFESQRERLYALLQLYLDAGPNDRPPLRQSLVDAAQKLVRDAQQLLEDLTADDIERAMATRSRQDADEALLRQAHAYNAAGHARLILARLAEEESRYVEALAQLTDFETRYAADMELVREAISRRISALIAADRIDEAGEQARLLMQLFEDEAAGTVNHVVNTLERQIDQLRRQASVTDGAQQRQRLMDRAASLAQVLVTLTGLLHDWALSQNFDAQEMLPYRLVRIKALCLAQQGAEAVEAASLLYRAFPNDALVRHHMGEALFTHGMQADSSQDLIAAAGHFDALIQGLQHHRTADGKRPELYWNAWMRRAQIMDRLDQFTQDIPIRVNNLLTEDPSLGGEPYRSELLRLRNKYTR